MFIPWWGIVIIVGLYIYLFVVNTHLHKRVQKLEKTVRKLEGMNGEAPKHHRNESENLT